MQPSVNDIASLYRGNPQALQARMQKEPQIAPGIPADLKQLLALNIVTNEENGMARQQAMQQLNQMAPQGEGQMPTIAQSIQEQAKQKLQAQMMQQQQQQQAMQQMAGQMQSGSVPPGTPQPQRQPQGIDELPAEFSLAGGGIVAFQSRGSVPEPTESELKAQKESDAKILEAITSTLGKTAGDTAAKLVAAGADIASLIPRGLAGAMDTAIIRPARAMGADIGYISPALTPGAQSSDTATPFYDRYIRAREEASAKEQAPQRDEAPRSYSASEAQATQAAGPQARVPVSSPAPVRDLRQLAEQQKRAAPEVSAITGTPAATSQMSPLFQEAQSLEAERMRAIPEAGAANKEAGYQSRVAAPDFTQRDAMIKLLQEERGRQAEPKEGWGSLMEYLGQIAATPRGMTSFEAGAAGARGQAGLQEQRAQKRLDLGSKIIEQEQGKIDASRQYAKEVYGIGEKEYDRIYKEKLDAAMQITKNEMEAKKLAQEMTLKDMDIKQRQAEERGRFARHTIPLEQQVFAGYLRKAGGDVVKANELMRAAGVNERLATPTDRLRAAQTLLQNATDEDEAKFARDSIRKIMTEMKTPNGTEGAQAGKVPPPPPGFILNK